MGTGLLQVSKDGQHLAAVCGDKRIRVWRFASGKLRRVYDESLEAANEVQRSGAELFKVGAHVRERVGGLP